MNKCYKYKATQLSSVLILLTFLPLFDIIGSGTIAGPIVAETIWPDSKTPELVAGDGTRYVFGTIFRAIVPGQVTGLRVYSVVSESGVHTARLWRNADNTVIGGPYTWNYGGAAGWITLDIPDVAIEANTNYTVSISVGDGVADFPLIFGDTAAAGGNGTNLFYPANAGVYTIGAGARPDASFGNNYLRDVVFMPEFKIIAIEPDLVTGNITIRWEGPGTLFRVERATAVEGPFAPIGTQQAERNFTDPGVLKTNGTFFYRISR